MSNFIGGGASYDIGVYPMAWMFMVFKRKPDKVVANGRKAATGVDLDGGVICTWEGEDGGLGNCSWGFTGAWQEGKTIYI